MHRRSAQERVTPITQGFKKGIGTMTNAGHHKLGRSRAVAAKVIFAAFQVLKEKGGELPGREVINEVEKRVHLDDWAKERYAKTGYVRWQSILHFFTIDCIKAGFLIKKRGTWYLTPEGEQALSLGEVGLLAAASQAYWKWRAENPKLKKTAEDDEATDEEAEQTIDIDQIEQQGSDSLKEYVILKTAYEFQDLIAALLRGMGYFTPFVAPPGKDGGVDIIAYRDPLGTVSPRIKVQVKHRQGAARVDEIRQLMGLLQKDGDVGMFISTTGFTSDAVNAARGSHVHVELIDLNRFIELWLNFYNKMTDDDKRELPLRAVYFLAPSE